MSGFVKAMNKRYKAKYTIWAYMDDLLNISSLQQEQPKFKVGDTIKPKAYNESHRINKINDDNYVLDNGFTFPIVGQDVWEIVEQKPVNSVFSFDDVLALESAMALAKDEKKLYDALNSIFERVLDIYHGNISKPEEWSKEDEKCIKDIIICLDYLKREDTERQWNGDRNVNPKRYDSMIAKLKSLRPQPKQEWTEEDEKYLNLAINIVASNFGEDSPTVSWLKCIKDRIQ